METITVDLSAPRDSSVGRMVNDLYGGAGLLELLMESKVTGFPYNGGSHTLRITGSRSEVTDFVRILHLQYPYAAREIFKIRKEMLLKDKVVYMKIENRVL